MLKRIVYKLMLFGILGMFSLHLGNQFVAMIYIHQGMEQLKQDAYVLSSILEQENCLSIDTLDGNSRYSDFVNNTLRASETEIFKYDVAVTDTGNVIANPDLMANDWSGIDNEENAIQIDVADTSYTTCSQRGDVVTATLTMTVYTPTLFENLIEYDDPFAAEFNRMKKEITQEIEVIGFKYYKGKG